MEKTKEVNLTFKQKVIESLSRLPDNASRDDVLYRVHILHGLDEADEHIANGQTISQEEMERRYRPKKSTTT